MRKSVNPFAQRLWYGLNIKGFEAIERVLASLLSINIQSFAGLLLREDTPYSVALRFNEYHCL
jgi:hypothetical protein